MSRAVPAAAAAAPARGNRAEIAVQYSKRLPQGDEDLSRFESRRRIKVVTDVNAHRADRRRVAESGADGIRVLRAEVVEPDRLEDVAAVIEHHEPEVLVHDGQVDRRWNPQLRIDNRQLCSAHRHGDERAGRWIRGVTAGRYRALRARSVQGESAQR